MGTKQPQRNPRPGEKPQAPPPPPPKKATELPTNEQKIIIEILAGGFQQIQNVSTLRISEKERLDTIRELADIALSAYRGYRNR